MAGATEFAGKRVLVTGAAGTVGRELIRQITQLSVDEIVCIDNNESALFNFSEEMQLYQNVRFALCDISDLGSLTRLIQGMDIVIHAAALKHVPICERMPSAAVRTNILGTENLITAAAEGSLRKLIAISTDKAVNPTSVMGTSKLMGERLVTAANAQFNVDSDKVFWSLRFGNVAGSHGSVIPLFCDQIARGGPVRLTHPTMTRFVMTLEMACRMILRTVDYARGGEVFVTKMPVVTIKDLAQVMIEIVAPAFGRNPRHISIEEVGIRPGEKLWEELISEEEVRRTYEVGDFLVVVPALTNLYRPSGWADTNRYHRISRPYRSDLEAPMSRSDIASFLLQDDVLPTAIRNMLASGSPAGVQSWKARAS
jgi:FlaA1/EpsC-like NDP-sugar epimerase